MNECLMNKMINSISLGKMVMPLGYEILTEFINLKLQNSEIYANKTEFLAPTPVGVLIA